MDTGVKKTKGDEGRCVVRSSGAICSVPQLSVVSFLGRSRINSNTLEGWQVSLHTSAKFKFLLTLNVSWDHSFKNTTVFFLKDETPAL